jgi:hypothetical protein
MLDRGTGLSVRGIVLNRSSRCIRITVVLAASAIMVAGCADSRLAASNATSNSAAGAQASSEAPYHTAYGLTSDGPTTDLYTELFGSSQRDNGTATTVSATAQQVQPGTAPAATQQVQPATASATNRQGQRATASAANRQVQPAPLATTQVAQQPTPSQPPPEPDTPTAYGITSNGPTTDLYTELFGPRRRDGQ